MADTTDAGPAASTPGTVAHEAALLVDLIARQGWAGAGSGAAGAPAEGEAEPAVEAGTCTCGGTTPAACRLCPVCQLISFVKLVSPDTIERVAEVVDLAAIALRDLARAQRDRAPSAGPQEPAPDPSESRP